MGVVELRIHGVGGSPGEALLGLSHADDAVVVGEGIGTIFLARREQRDIEGYDWGALTSGSPLQPLWTLLLPFTLINAAGWAHPAWEDRNGWRIRLIRALTHVAAALLTGSWILWFGVIGVDYLGYQWLGPHIGQLKGAVAGFILTVGLAWLLWWIARSSKSGFEAVRAHENLLPAESRPKRWGRREDLTKAEFFSHERSMSRSLGWHIGVAGVTILALAAKTVVAWQQPRLLLGEIFVVVGALQVGVILALAAVSWRSGGQYDGIPKPPALPAAAVAIAFTLTNGFFSGLALLAAKLVPGARPWGPELALIDGFVVMLIAWVVFGAVWVLGYRKRGRSEDIPDRTTGPSEELNGADPRWKKRIAATRGLALAGHAAPRLLPWLAVMFILVGAVWTFLRLEIAGPPWQWLQEPRPSLLLTAAGWLLPALVLAFVGLTRRAVTGKRLRRTIGILWDVLTFWPRRYHPLAVRPYTERAVPEFQARVTNHLLRGRKLFVSAHSQGSVIAFAALAPLGNDKLQRVDLLTYGSPITTLYGQVFPAYLGKHQVELLRERLLGEQDGWRNLWRRTDPIGGPVIGTGTPPVDEHVPDPAIAPASEDIPVGPAGTEEPRRAWVSLAGHSYFYREQAYKDAVTDLRTRLASSFSNSISSRNGMP